MDSCVEEYWCIALCRNFTPVVGVILIVAGATHTENPYYFLSTVLAYDLLAPGASVFAAMLVPSIQIVLGVCLVTGVFANTARLLTVVLLCGFVFAQLSAVMRQLEISCGCYGVGHDLPLGWTSISVTALLLIFMSVPIFAREKATQGGPAGVYDGRVAKQQDE